MAHDYTETGVIGIYVMQPRGIEAAYSASSDEDDVHSSGNDVNVSSVVVIMAIGRI